MTLPWHVPFALEEKYLLTGVGEEELYHIGKRLRARFSQFFAKKSYSPRWYSFVSTDTKRTTHSASSLAAGIFDGYASIDDRIQPIALEVLPSEPNDRLLRFYEACDNYRTEIAEKPVKEYVLFQNGPEVRAVIKKIENKINVQDLTYADVNMIFLGCAYEIAIFSGSMDDELCALLDENDRMVLEYARDLEKFYLTANPFKPLSYQIACPLLKDITNTLNESAQNRTELIGIFRSTHSSALLMINMLLGFNPQLGLLRHDNYEQMKNRNFRSSIIAPFSANLYFVLYECEGSTKIQLYLNERLQRIPCCSNEVDCDFQVLLKCYEHYTENCEENFKDLCTKSKNSEELGAKSSDVRFHYNKWFFFVILFVILL